MKTPDANQNAVEPSEWVGFIAAGAVTRDEKRRQAQDVEREQRTRFCEVVATDGAVFFQRLEAEFVGIATAFNARVGFRLLDTHQSPSGALSMGVARTGHYVLVVPDLSTDQQNEPGCDVTLNAGRSSRRPYRFVIEGARLRMWADQQALSPEGFARHVLEPWLSGLALGGR